VSVIRYPWETPPVVIPPDPPPARPKPRGRRPASAAPPAADWLFQHLTVTGPAAIVAAFAAATRGAGVIPWQLDLAGIEEDIFHLAVAQPAAQRNLTVAGCRILARQFRARVELRQARAAERIGRSLLCPFDLHTLLPVPPAILALGPTHPTALGWLRAHWGVTDRLRQVSVLPRPALGRRLPQGHAVHGWGFFTGRPPALDVAGAAPVAAPDPRHNPCETPAPAVAAIAAHWPALRFALIPRSAR
jgi:hypothetical protein